MLRYIDAERMKTVKEIQKADFNTVETIREWIDSQPTVDVVPVVHAHWIANSRYCEYTCSHCGDGWRGDFDLDPSDDHFYYCPHCGAIMDEEVS